MKKALLAILFLLFPVVLLSFFTFPCADDFNYAIEVLHRGFGAAQMHWYQSWSGRYLSTALLSVSPVLFRSFLGYHLISLFTVCAFAAANSFFFKTVLRDLLPMDQIRLVSFLFLAVYLSQLPSMAEGFYWIPGIVNYTWAFLLLLVMGTSYLRMRGWGLAPRSPYSPTPFKVVLWCGFLILGNIFLAGLNETLILVEFFLVGAAIVFYYRKYRKMDWVLLAPIIAGAICFFIVFKAPGNEIRAARFTESKQLARTVGKSIGLSIEIFFRYLKPTFLLALGLSVPFLLRLRERIPAEFYQRLTRWLFIMGLAGTLIIFLAPAQWAMGSGPPKRALNTLCYLHMVFVALVWAQWVWAYPRKFEVWARFWDDPKKWRLSLVIFGLLLVFSGNHLLLWSDLLTKVGTYRQETLSREQVFARSLGQDVILRPYSVEPESVMFDDITDDPQDWRNAAVADFYGLRSVRREKRK